MSNSEFIRAVELFNVASMIVIPVAAVGHHLWQEIKASRRNKNAPASYLTEPYVPRFSMHIEAGQPKLVKGVIPKTEAKSYSR